MEINNRTVRLLSQTNNFTDENLWSFFEENFDLKLKSKQFLLKNKFILLDYNIIMYNIIIYTGGQESTKKHQINSACCGRTSNLAEM